MEKDNQSELVPQCVSELNDLADKIGFIGTALIAQETAVLRMDIKDLREAGKIPGMIKDKILEISEVVDGSN